MPKTVEKDDSVEISYVLKLEDDTVLETTQDKGPFRFSAGSEEIIKGVSEAVIGMGVGDTKKVQVVPEEGFGEYSDELVVSVPKEKLPDNVKTGDLLSDGQGQQPWRVLELKEADAVLDGNHPLAGKELVFEIELLSINA